MSAIAAHYAASGANGHRLTAPPRDNLDRFYPSLVWLSFAFGAAEALVAAASGHPAVAASAVLTGWFTLMLLVSGQQIRAGNTTRGRFTVAVSVTALGTAGAFLVPGVGHAMALLPVLSLVLVLPLLRREHLVLAFAAAAFVSAATLVLGAGAHPLPALTEPFASLFPNAVFAAIIVLVLIGLGDYSLTARNAVSELRARSARDQRLNDERLAVVAALRTLEPQATAEETARLLATALSELPKVDWGVVIEATDGVLTVLAGDGNAPLPAHTGDALPSARAAYLLRRSTTGAWAELFVDRPVPALEDARLEDLGVKGEAFAPIWLHDEMVGLICVVTTDAEQADHLVAELPAVTEFASVASVILAPALVAKRKVAAERPKVRSVIDARSFRPVFQPVVDTRTGKAVGFEALTRFDDGGRPDQLFAAAREVGLGLELETATLDAAMRGTAGLPVDAWLAINASPAFVLGGDLGGILSRRTRPVVIEITENETITDYAAVRDAVRAFGPDVRVAVDDAGAGVANFHHIVELRPDFVKLDISLIRGLNADLTRQALVVGVEHFARATDRFVIAEGVETDEELETLRNLGIRLAQGYLLGRPAPAEAFRIQAGS